MVYIFLHAHFLIVVLFFLWLHKIKNWTSCPWHHSWILDTYLEFLWHSSWKPIQLLLYDLLWELDIRKETMHIHKNLWAWSGNIPKQHYCWVYIEIMFLICWAFHFKESFKFLNGKDMKLECILTYESKTINFNLGFHNWMACRVKERWWIYNFQP